MAGKDRVDDILDQWQRERPDLDASPMGVIGRLSRLSRELERRLDPIYARYGLEAGLSCPLPRYFGPPPGR